MPWGAAVAAGASILGSSMQANSTEDAADAQRQSSEAAIAEQRRQYDLNRSDLAPYRNAGGAAVTRLGELLGIGAKNNGDFVWNGKSYVPSNSQNPKDMRNLDISADGTYYTPDTREATTPGYGDLNKKFTLADFWDDPVTKASYQSGLDEGTKGLDRIAGARGSRNSGAQLKALERFGTDYTGQQAAGSSARFYGDQDRTFNRLAGVAGVGQTATNTGVAAGSNTANNIGNIMTAQGNARGAASIAGGNAYAGAGTNIGNWWNQQQTLNRIAPKQGSTGNVYGTGGGPNPYYGSDYVDS